MVWEKCILLLCVKKTTKQTNKTLELVAHELNPIYKCYEKKTNVSCFYYYYYYKKQTQNNVHEPNLNCKLMKQNKLGCFMYKTKKQTCPNRSSLVPVPRAQDFTPEHETSAKRS